MPWPKAILLDFYGTLVEEDTAVIKAISEEIAYRAPGNITPLEVAGCWGNSFSALCKQSFDENYDSQVMLEERSLSAVLKTFNVDLDPRQLSKPLISYWRQPLCYPEVAGVLADCSVPICLVSNIDNAELVSALAHNTMAFSYVVTSEGCRAYKPHPAPFLRALELLQLEPHEVLHIGDSLASDVRGAQALGITAMWINRSGRTLPEDCSPEYVSSNLIGLQQLLIRSTES